MRTGANFARGSCRALRWMVVLGVFSVLGSPQAVAQDTTMPTLAGATATFSGTTVTVELADTGDGVERVWGGATPASVFVTSSTEADSHTVPTASGRASNTFTVTFPDGTTMSGDLQYTAPISGANTDIVDLAGNRMSTGQVAMTEMDTAPVLTDVDDMTFMVGELVSEELDEATGGNGVLAYQVIGLPDGLIFTATNNRMITGSPTAMGSTEVTYIATDDDADLSGGPPNESDATTFMITVEGTARTRRTGEMGEVIGTALSGSSLTEKTIGGIKRNHVSEGARDLEVTVSVEWDVDELRDIWAAVDEDEEPEPVELTVEIMSDESDTRDWLSMIDEEQDVHFPRPAGTRGILTGIVEVDIPDEPEDTDRGSSVRTATGSLEVYILDDDFEAENEVFYIEVTDSDDVDVDRSRGGNLTTAVTVIEDDEEQKVTVKQGSSTGPTMVYEDDGELALTLAASPARDDLPLEVLLEMVDLDGDTVSSAKISLEDASITLNSNGTGNSTTVTVHLPNPDGDRMDDEYDLNASVNLHSLSSGGYEKIDVVSHRIEVVDVHKLPRLMVMPAEGTVMEDGSTMLTLTIDRNPPDTTRRSGEQPEYSYEEVNVMLTAGDGTTADMSDYRLPAMVTFEEWDGAGSSMDSMMVEVMAMKDDVINEEEMLVLDAEVEGTENAKYGPNTDYDMYSGVSMLTIEDETDVYVWANDADEVYPLIMAAIAEGAGEDGMLSMGETVEIPASALFSHVNMDGLTIEYAASSDDAMVLSAEASNTMVMLMAESAMGGTAHVTITATAILPSGLKIIDQVDPKVAQMLFPVEVSSTVPALPVIAQLLLAAFLAIGGYRRRRYLLRR